MGARALILVALVACAGPSPSATIVDIAPSPQPGHQRVTVAVRNDGGHGEVTVDIALRGRRGVVVRDERRVEMDAGEHLLLTIDVPASPDVFEGTVVAKYPD